MKRCDFREFKAETLKSEERADKRLSKGFLRAIYRKKAGFEKIDSMWTAFFRFCLIPQENMSSLRDFVLLK